MSTRFLLVAILLLATRAVAQDANTPDFHADHLDFDIATSEALGQGNARLNYRGALITADEIRFNQRTQTAVAFGHVELTRGTQRLLADSITYRLTDRFLSVKGLRLGDFPLYLSADSVEGDPKSITAHNATVSYHEPTLLGPRLRAKTITYVPGVSIAAENAQIGLGKFQPLPLQKFRQNVNEPIISYLEGTVGYRNSLGAFLEVGAHAPLWPGVWLGGDVNSYSKRGFLVGPSGRYKVKTDDTALSGSFRTGYINDYGDRLTDNLNRNISSQRGFIDWTHRQTVGEKLSVFGEFHYWSDSEITRDFRAKEFYPLQQPDTFLEADYRATGNAILSVFTRFQPNTYYRVQQRLPEVRFDLLPSALAGGIYQRLNASAAVLRERGLSGEEEKRTNRFDAYYGLDRPITPTPWFTFTPVAGARLTHYADNSTGRSSYTRGLGEVGFDAVLRASGKFNYQNKLWKIDGLRHLMEPNLSYRYIPSADKGLAYIPQIDDEVFVTYLRPLGLGDSRSIDRLHETNTVRIGLNNTLQTRDPKYGSRDLVRLDLAADLHLEQFEGERDYSDLHTELVVTPVHWLAFNLYQRIDPSDATVREINTGVTIHDGNQWAARLSTHYLEDQIEEYVTEGSYRLNEVYRVGARIHYDSRQSRFVEQSFNLIQNIDNLWRVRYGVSVYNGSRRESNFGFSLNVELAGF